MRDQMPQLLVLSGSDSGETKTEAGRLLSCLRSDSGLSPGEMAARLMEFAPTGLARAALLVADRADAVRGLTALVHGVPFPGLFEGTGSPGALAALFTGIGAHWPGMGHDLWSVFPDCAAVLDDVLDATRAADPRLGAVVHEGIFAGTADPELDRIDAAQVGLFAVQAALSVLLDRWGLRPAYVLGHSAGELAAALAAGVLTPADATRLLLARARLMRQLPPGGTMMSLQAPETRVRAVLAEHPEWFGRIAVAVVNGPDATVVSGDDAVVRAVGGFFAAQGHKTKLLRVDRAIHSARVDPMLGSLSEIALQLRFSSPAMGFVSNLSGAADGEVSSPDYWIRQLREPVRFGDGIAYLEAQGVTSFVEIGPDAVLGPMARAVLRAPEAAETTSLLRRDRPGLTTVRTALAQLYVNGVNPDWRAVARDLCPDVTGHAVRCGRFWVTGAPLPDHPLAQVDPIDQGQPDLAVLVAAHAGAVLGLDADHQLDVGAGFQALGFDSAAAVDLCARLSSALGMRVPPTAIFEYPTLTALTAHVTRLLRGEADTPFVRPQVGTAPVADLVAIIGMSCRFPGGVESPEDLWRLLVDERDVISDFPVNRGWPTDVHAPGAPQPGRTYVRVGGFLHDADLFDAGFFGISPREAAAMDPQQRLLLETSWEAVERAGIAPESLRGTNTGVYVGATAQPYGPELTAGSPGNDGFLLTGTTPSVLSGRISYALGLEGPALTVDTACSSSLVALHAAVQALRMGECSLAMAAGATVMATPGMFVEFAQQRGLAADGRCKAFAEGADGTVWGEGVGVLVLERLSDAQRNGHRVLAVVRATATNQDGASNGLTAPNGIAQRRVVETALARAGLTAADVDAVEAHGTGTRLGDPIEAAALIDCYGRHPDRQHPLLLGSVKSNLGHPQAAAGVAGVIKIVLALYHGTLPKSLHVDVPSSMVDWADSGVALLTNTRSWPDTGRPRRAGVSAFGISGTNAHVILEQAPAVPDLEADRTDAPVVWPLSGRSVAALRAQAARLVAFLEGFPDDELPSPAAVARALSRRSVFEHRAVVVGSTADELIDGCRATAIGAPCGNVWQGRDEGSRPVAFLFPGQGTQHPGMGRALYREFPVFADAFDEVCALFDAELGGSLKDVVFDGGDQLDRTQWTQAGLFAVELARFRLLESCGLRPDILLGHSLGEIVAAHVAGVLPLPDAVAVVTARGRAMAASPDGAMVAIDATAVEVEAALAGVDDGWIAAVNGPRHVVVSGAPDTMGDLVAMFTASGHRARRLRVVRAFHSPWVADAMPELSRVLETVTFRPPALPLVSNVTGRFAGPDDLTTSEYWLSQAMRPVRFADGVESAWAQGARVLVDVGPDGILAAMASAVLDGHAGASVVALQQGPGDERAALLAGLARLHVSGTTVNWSAVLPPAADVQLPTYAFQRERYWLSAGTRTSQVESAPVAPPRIEDERTDVHQAVRAHLAAVLGHRDPKALPAGQSFLDLGMTSLMAVEFRDRVVAATGVMLPVTAVYDHVTPESLAEHVISLLDGSADDDTPVVEAPPVDDADDPIVIVGMGCRYPGGVTSPVDLWELVSAGRDAISAFPTNRGWPDDLYDPDPDALGKTYAREGGFLHDAGEFDAGFFGISPLEAVAMDAQQRLLLEVTWEAVERAGVDPVSLRGTDTGVFVGVAYHDYSPRWVDAPRRLRDYEGYLQTGSSGSIASGRIAYALGLEGPALTVDTACSSSLVAIHLGAEALRRGECGLVVAGGATVVSTAQSFVEFARQRGLAVDGRCKSFGAGADGAGWGEGVGVVVLERLSDARRNGHPVHAIVRGSAVNQDGASNGMTAPNGRAQQRVIRAALRRAGLVARDVDVVEAHGTGTKLGDPVEAGALLATYGQDRAPDRPLWLGSVKSNIGHPQAAAGVAGVIKVVEAMRHEVLPPTLHAEVPSPLVDWASGAISLLTEQRAWPVADRPRRAGVSAFGISGTNAHVIIEEPPAIDVDSPSTVDDTVVVWPLAGKTAAAVRDQANDLLGRLDHNADLAPADVGSTLARRSVFDHRAAVVGSSTAELRAGLRAVADGTAAANAWTGRCLTPEAPVVLFSGQGAQRPGMGRGLYRELPVFAAAFDEVCALFDGELGGSLKDVVFGQGDQLNGTQWTQAGLFAFEVAQFRLLESWGLRPGAVLGHSLGELVAAHIAGVFALPEAVRVVAARGRLMAGLPDGGAMVSLRATEAEVAAAVADELGTAAIAAVNGPEFVVVSGESAAVERVAARFGTQGQRIWRLPVRHAFHSPLMEPMLADFADVLRTVEFGDVRLPLVSNGSGKFATAAELREPEYWIAHVRQPVRFADGLDTVWHQGSRVFIEVGPDGVLTGMAQACLDGRPDAVAIGTSRRGQPEVATLLGAVAQAHVAGVDIDWTTVLPVGRLVDLPTYPFQHKHYWLDETLAGGAGVTTADQPEGEPESVLVALLHDLAPLPAASQEERLRNLVRTNAATVLGHGDPSRVDPGQSFADLGLTSLDAIELRNRITASTGLPIPVTAIFDHATVVALAGHLGEVVAEQRAEVGDEPEFLPEPGPPAVEVVETADAIDSMDAEELLRLVFRDSGS